MVLMLPIDALSDIGSEDADEPSAWRDRYLWLPKVAFITQSSGGLEIVHIDKVDALSLQLPPYAVPGTNWPTRLIPVPQFDAFPVGRLHLIS